MINVGITVKFESSFMLNIKVFLIVVVDAQKQL